MQEGSRRTKRPDFIAEREVEDGTQFNSTHDSVGLSRVEVEKRKKDMRERERERERSNLHIDLLLVVRRNSLCFLIVMHL